MCTKKRIALKMLFMKLIFCVKSKFQSEHVKIVKNPGFLKKILSSRFFLR